MRAMLESREYMAAVLAIALLVAVPCAGGQYDLSWWTVDGGGGVSEGGGYVLTAVAGQADAGLLQGGAYVVLGGFLGGAWAEITSELVIAHLLGLTTLTGELLNAADRNGDGRVDMADVVLLVNQGK